MDEKIKKKLSNNYKFPNRDEIKINFKNNYCPKNENNYNITIIKNNFEININKLINPKINFGLKYKLIKFLLKTVNLTSIYLPNITVPQLNSENLNYFKLERFHEFKNYFYASNKSKFIENEYDMAFIEKISLKETIYLKGIYLKIRMKMIITIFTYHQIILMKIIQKKKYILQKGKYQIFHLKKKKTK